LALDVTAAETDRTSTDRTATSTAEQPTAPLVVEVWADVICPWCYIGKRRLEAALTEFEHRDQVEVVWRSFELDPTTPRSDQPGGGEDLASYLGRRFGGGGEAGREQGLAMNAQVSQIAAGDGLDFHLDQAVRANTVDAHRLLHLALETGGPQLQGRLKERLMEAHFVNGERVDTAASLQRIGEEVGLDADRVSQVLGSAAYADEVAADVDQARAFGANGVPFTVVDRRYAVSGAQPAQLFLQALQQAWADRTEPAPPSQP
jgi:predicted DsbA family dithiol-disulfide isomerase